jgi:tight adherence protein B
MELILFLTAFVIGVAVAYGVYDLIQQKETQTFFAGGHGRQSGWVEYGLAYLSRMRVPIMTVLLMSGLLFLGHYLLALGLVLAVLAQAKYQEIRRRREIVGNLPAAIAILTRSLRSGQTIDKALESVVEFTVSEELRALFKKIVQVIYISGRPPHEVLLEEAKGARCNEMIMLASILESHARIGGNIVDVLTIFEEQLRRNMITQKKIDSLMAEGQTSIMVLAAIPLVVFAAVYSTAPDYLQFFLQPEGRLGLILIPLFYLLGVGSAIALVKGR